MRCLQKQAASGFTLVELAVAVALFAVVALLAYGGLNSMARTRVQLEQNTQRLAAIQRTWDLLGRDLRQAALRPVRGNDGPEGAALSGTRTRVELTRYGYANSLAEPRAELERVAYLRTDKVLQRAHFPVLDRLAGTSPRSDALLDDVTALEFRYYSRAGRSFDEWPPPRLKDVDLPQAIEVRLTLDDYGEMRRLFELAEEAQ